MFTYLYFKSRNKFIGIFLICIHSEVILQMSVSEMNLSNLVTMKHICVLIATCMSRLTDDYTHISEFHKRQLYMITLIKGRSVFIQTKTW